MCSFINNYFVVIINPEKARKGVIYPLKTGIFALVGISERTFLNKGVRYAQIKISARTFHSLVSFAHKILCTLAALFNSACVKYKNNDCIVPVLCCIAYLFFNCTCKAGFKKK